MENETKLATPILKSCDNVLNNLTLPYPAEILHKSTVFNKINKYLLWGQQNEETL